MSNPVGVLQETGNSYPSRAPGFNPGILVVYVLLIFLVFCVLFRIYVFYPLLHVSLDCPSYLCLLPVVACFSELSFVSMSFTRCCMFLWIVLRIYVFYPLLHVSLDCPFLIDSSVFFKSDCKI